MHRSKLGSVLPILLALILVLPASLVRAQEASPIASPMSETGAGPTAVTGTLSVENFAAAQIYQKPTVALLDATALLPVVSGTFVPESSQILGYFTTPPFQATAPGTYQVDLPIEPHGETISFGGDADGGVQVFQLVIGNNVVGDAYLQQIEQGGLSSILFDSETGAFVLGNLLVFSADDQQDFPIGAGTDGQWFTGDDALQPLEHGYTVVHLTQDGTATFDRNETGTLDIVEDPAQASLDLSGMGLLDSYNALIDRLAQRYSFTELRGIDWEAIRTQYLPMIEEADTNNDLGEYAYVLLQIQSSIHDAHVSLIPSTPDSIAAYQQAAGVMAADYLANVGAYPVFIPDPDNRTDPTAGVVQLLAVGDSGPAFDAGWVPGTEIVSINGQTVDERRAMIPLAIAGQAIGTEAQYINVASQLLLNFAPGEQVTIEYKLPDEDDVRSVDMVAGQYPQGITSPTPREWPEDSATYQSFGGYTVIHWNEFTDDFPTKIAIMEEALKAEAAKPSNGVILDMRGNGGGWAGGYLTLASYFFTADNPLQTPTFDNWTYSEEAGDLVKEFDASFALSSPNPAVAYTGPLTILVDQNCGSSCEFFTQTLQTVGRATVIGQFATAGAGGNIDQVTLPGGFIFQYTVGRSYYAGTDDLNIEGKGVTPDIWLPVTIDTTLAALSDPDYVLNMAVAAISQPAEGDGTPEAIPSPAA